MTREGVDAADVRRKAEKARALVRCRSARLRVTVVSRRAQGLLRGRSSLLTIHGRNERRVTDELIVFYKNPRDPATNHVSSQSRQNAGSIELLLGHRTGRIPYQAQRGI